jgi:hypothetical protein
LKDFYANAYPELTQSIIEGPDVSDEGLTYTFRKSVGTKGNDTVSVSEIACASYLEAVRLSWEHCRDTG